MNIRTLFDKKKTVFSLEIFPPKKTAGLRSIYYALEAIRHITPDYISVTYGAGGSVADIATRTLAMDIKNVYGIEPLVHLTCINSTKEEVENQLVHLERLRLLNVLALRGDRQEDAEPRTDFKYASELVTFIKERGAFNVVGACYPEGHVEAESAEADILHLKKKVDAGVTHLNSQLFFDNAYFYRFLERAEKAGIAVPIQAGIMPVTNKRQIERMASLSGATLPRKFTDMMRRYEKSDSAMFDAGLAYATDQIVDLIANGCRGIHLYTMNNPTVALKIYGNIKNILAYANETED